MFHRLATLVTRIVAMAILVSVSWGAQAQQQPPYKMTLFGIPVVSFDSIWMAIDRGFYKEEGLDLTLRLFPSGTTGLQSFQTGQGDIVMSGDLPSLQYFFRNGNYQHIAALERQAKGYIVVSQKSIAKPQDLIGKTIATRVGSVGSWFVSEYLKKNNIDPAKVTIKNLDAQVVPAALCKGEIDAFFLWEPLGSRTLEICPEKAHYLSTAEGYIQGYSVVGARRDWLETPVGKEVATRFLRATLKGKAVAESDFAAVAAYAKAKFDLSEKAVRDQYDFERAIALDKVYYDDFCKISRWAQSEKITTEKLDFTKLTWPDGLRAIDPKRVAPPPPPC